MRKYFAPSKNLTYFMISDILQDKVLIKHSCFWKMKANYERAGLASFLVNKVTPTCQLLHTAYHYPQGSVNGNFGT